mmetsp:Transcript_7856/g.20935  ORF Transcript_7856/g.20935 Transcript_7856/m.20935 type:complete len:87 (-) Transcript_7856:978-1238(-)
MHRNLQAQVSQLVPKLKRIKIAPPVRIQNPKKYIPSLKYSFTSALKPLNLFLGWCPTLRLIFDSGHFPLHTPNSLKYFGRKSCALP